METGRHARTAVLCAALVTALASAARAQNQLWIRQIGTVGYDVAEATTTDGSDGVYVCGLTDRALGGPHLGSVDGWLARYDGGGSLIWSRQLGTSAVDLALAAATDGSGGVYVGGMTAGSYGGMSSGGDDAWLARFDGSGTLIWIRQLGTSSHERVMAAAPDGLGGVFVSGITDGSIGGPHAGVMDIWLARYDAAGGLAWIRQFGTNDHESVGEMAADGAGGVYVCGATHGNLSGTAAGFADSWLARYDGTGSQTWIRQFGTSQNDFASGVAPDGSGGVFCAGGTFGSLGGLNIGHYDVWVARFDGAGASRWVQQFGTNARDTAVGAAPDGVGGVFVCGDTHGALGGPNAGWSDAWFARYDGAGNRAWIRQVGTSRFDPALAATPDELGGVYFCGRTSGILAGTSAGGTDAWVARYDNGLLTTRYCTPAIPNSTGQAAMLDATGRNAVAANDITLEASRLPHHSVGYFLTSRAQGSTYPVTNSQGRLCLDGMIGRFVGPGRIQSSGATGSFSLSIDLTALPQPMGHLPAQAGETWSFQAWFHDVNPTATSNFTDALGVAFL